MVEPRAPVLLAATRFALPDGAQILHWIPGRIRFRHPSLTDSQSRLEICSHIAAQPGVRSVRANARIACLIFTYDFTPNVVTPPPSKLTVSSALERAFSILEFVSAFVKVPYLGTLLEIADAIRYARAAVTVMYRRYNGFSIHAVLAYAALLLSKTTLLDFLLPRYIHAGAKFMRTIAPMLQAAFKQPPQSVPLLALSA